MMGLSAMMKMRLRFLRLQIGGIQKNETGKLGGCLGRDDFPPVSPLDEKRKAAAMVQMGVRQENKIDLAFVEAERHAIILRECAAALKQAAIDQNAPARGFQKMARTCDILRRTVKGDFHANDP